MRKKLACEICKIKFEVLPTACDHKHFYCVCCANTMIEQIKKIEKDVLNCVSIDSLVKARQNKLGYIAGDPVFIDIHGNIKKTAGRKICDAVMTVKEVENGKIKILEIKTVRPLKK